MRVGVLKETYPGERRVALVPAALSSLVRIGADIIVERGAGTSAGFLDRDYEEKGAKLVDRAGIFAGADVILQVRSYGANQDAGAADLEHLSSKHYVIGAADPLGEAEAQQKLAATGATSFALELIPRITRAQSMDVLSSMATIAGYKAVLIAANSLPKMFPMMMTAAGTLTPARVFVIGCGVAGLQACATAKRLGAVVEAYDVRPAVKEQVQSVGAKFIELDLDTAEAEDAGGYAKEQGEDFLRRQREQMGKVVAENDVIITTAAIPGRQSPVLVTAEMVRGMKPGSVIVDLASERGGNCEGTVHGQTVETDGVVIIGPENIPSSIPNHASQMFARNTATFLAALVEDGEISLNMDDEVVTETLVTRNSEVVHPRVREILGLTPSPASIGSD